MIPLPDSPARCLVVDDEPLVRRSVVRMLEPLGFRCIEAGTGKQALDALESSGELPLIVSDLRMPELEMAWDAPFTARDLLGGETFSWTGARNFVELHPGHQPGHVLAIEPDEPDVEPLRQLDCQRAWSRYRGHDRDAEHDGLLNQLVAQAPG